MVTPVPVAACDPAQVTLFSSRDAVCRGLLDEEGRCETRDVTSPADRSGPPGLSIAEICGGDPTQECALVLERGGEHYAVELGIGNLSMGTQFERGEVAGLQWGTMPGTDTAIVRWRWEFRYGPRGPEYWMSAGETQDAGQQATSWTCRIRSELGSQIGCWAWTTHKSQQEVIARNGAAEMEVVVDRETAVNWTRTATLSPDAIVQFELGSNAIGYEATGPTRCKLALSPKALKAPTPPTRAAAKPAKPPAVKLVRLDAQWVKFGGVPFKARNNVRASAKIEVTEPWPSGWTLVPKFVCAKGKTVAPVVLDDEELFSADELYAAAPGVIVEFAVYRGPDDAIAGRPDSCEVIFTMHGPDSPDGRHVVLGRRCLDGNSRHSRACTSAVGG